VPDSQRAALPTIYEAAIQAAGDPTYGELVDLLGQAFDAQLIDLFDGDAKYTVFGPTNAAFATLLSSLDSAQISALLDVQNGLLARILLYHVASGDWYAETFPVGALEMASGDLASVYWDGEVVTIEGATILGETVFKNGIFHGIDTVIIPPGFIDDLNDAADD
jgi:uncharacterized surface protein with fasciclin (FAS1) repeats